MTDKKKDWREGKVEVILEVDKGLLKNLTYIAQFNGISVEEFASQILERELIRIRNLGERSKR